MLNYMESKAYTEITFHTAVYNNKVNGIQRKFKMQNKMPNTEYISINVIWTYSRFIVFNLYVLCSQINYSNDPNICKLYNQK